MNAKQLTKIANDYQTASMSIRLSWHRMNDDWGMYYIGWDVQDDRMLITYNYVDEGKKRDDGPYVGDYDLADFVNPV